MLEIMKPPAAKIIKCLKLSHKTRFTELEGEKAYG